MKVKVQALHQIEITSRCNLKCSYCVHKTMPRPKQDMDYETFEKSLRLARKFVEAGTQHELNLAGIGESTMHPDFVDWVKLARAAVGWNTHLVLSTNGVDFSDEAIEGIAATGISIWVSPHSPKKAMPAILKLQEVGLFRGTSEGAWTSPVNWAGQVNWPSKPNTEGTPCPWLYYGRTTVFSDGRISTCCFDSDGSGVVGTIDDLLEGKELYVEPFRLCGPCHHEVVEPQTNQAIAVGDCMV